MLFLMQTWLFLKVDKLNFWKVSLIYLFAVNSYELFSTKKHFRTELK